jgi:hypothetical protein
MEPSGRNRWRAWQMTHPRTPLKQAETVAVGCDRLPRKCHGKEGVARAVHGLRATGAQTGAQR